MASKYGWFVYRGTSDRLDVDGQLLVRDGSPARLPLSLVKRIKGDKTVRLEEVPAPPDSADEPEDTDTPPDPSEILGTASSLPDGTPMHPDGTPIEEPGSPGKE